ncbi:MAG TPA: flagellar basal body rod protein FlgB [Pirellulales bacterium]|jgi:flagellar basal-body rod protein FlgB|nr:flagellar basal body rod protein FlgB [Pirellulales bacterium]
MSLSIFDSPVLEHVVRFTAARHNVLAGNIANIDTPGYRAADLSPEMFQTQLKEAVEASRSAESNPSDGSTDETTEAYQSVAATAHTLVYHDGTNLDIEQQASELAKNMMQYNLALSLMTTQFHTFEAVISERA